MNINNNNTGRGNRTQINRSNFAQTRNSTMQNTNNLPERVRHLSDRITIDPQRGFTQLTPELATQAQERTQRRGFGIMGSDDYNIRIIRQAFGDRRLPYYRFQEDDTSQSNRTTRNDLVERQQTRSINIQEPSAVLVTDPTLRTSISHQDAEVISVEPEGVNFSFSSLEGQILIQTLPEDTAEPRRDTRQQSDTEEEHN